MQFNAPASIALIGAVDSMLRAMTATPSRTRALADPPGGMMFWIIVALELLTFSMVFGALAVYRTRHPDEFGAGQEALNANLGLMLTLVLVTSGAFAARGVHAFRCDKLQQARRWFMAAALSGVVFVVIKAIDYAEHSAAGHGFGCGTFWDAYVLATAFHFAHVLVGIALLVSASMQLSKGRPADTETGIAGVALFWHMCDVAWFFLFPLFYAPIS